MSVALITGITGQDGAYLAELLLAKGYGVHGIKRRSSSFNTGRIDHSTRIRTRRDPRFVLHYGDMTDATNLIRIVQETQPDEIYNLAAQSHVQVSFETPEYTANADALGTLRLLEAIRILGLEKQDALLPGLDLRAVRHGPGRAAARDDALLSAQPLCGGQALRLLDHGELPRGLWHPRLQRHPVQPRKPAARRNFVTRKITRAVAAIQPRAAGDALSRQSRCPARLGPRARLCRGHVAMLQQDEPDDYVLATGETHTVREFVEPAFDEIGITTSSGAARASTRSGRLTQQTGKSASGSTALFPADRGRPADRRSLEGTRTARLAPQGRAGRVGQRDGQR